MTDDQNDAYKDAQQAEQLRVQIFAAASSAVHYGHIDRDWANKHLNRMGANLITGTATYQINAPIDGVYGITVTASNRAEALDKFKTHFDLVVTSGEFRSGNYGQGVYQITAAPGGPVVFSGPEDIEPTTDTVPGLDALKTAIRQMLKEGVTDYGWGFSYAQAVLADMGLEPLPAVHYKTVKVPVSGTADVQVMVFGEDDDDAVQASVAVQLSRGGSVVVKPEEIGLAFSPRSGVEVAGFVVVDDEDDED